MKRQSLMKNIRAFVCAVMVFCAMPLVCFASSDPAAATVKDGNSSIFYGVVFIMSVILLFSYVLGTKCREKKFVWLYCCITVANLGYFLISVARNLQWALWANRIGYLGSAYAVLAMVIIVSELCQIKFRRIHKAVLVFVTTAAFLFASTGGWLNIYYSDVSLEIVNGVASLVKCYAPLHFLYTVYVLAYFILMVAMVIIARGKNNIASTYYAVFLVSVVLLNIAVWGVEQFIDIDFEFLSISYVATGLFMLLIRSLFNDYNELRSNGLKAALSDETRHEAVFPPDVEELFEGFKQRMAALTPGERTVLQCIIDGNSLEETAELLFISVNTVRKHNTNLKRKLELSSREELSLYIDLFRRAGRLDEISYLQ